MSFAQVPTARQADPVQQTVQHFKTALAVGRSDRSTVTIVRPAGLSASRAATGAVVRRTGWAVVTSVSAPTVTWEGFSHVVPSPGSSVPNCMVRPVPARSSKRMRWT
ncbi:hypothetical protein GCM10010295_62410 [Streptomyces intermedius]